jgi:hypothetical protein
MKFLPSSKLPLVTLILLLPIMAKTFKKPLAEPAKPISERDFFDLTDDPLPQGIVKQGGKDNNNIGNTSNTKGKTSAVFAVDATTQHSPALDTEPVERALRQTFVVSSSQLEQLRDFVHARRVQGDYEYSQKQALQEALAMLFASVPQTPPRPDQTRESEQRRRDRISRGRRAGGSE